MDAATKKDILRVYIAGVLGTLFFHLALGQALFYFIVFFLDIPQEDWALASAVIPLTSVLHVVSAFLTERLRRRKVLSLSCFALARLAVPALMVLPLVSGSEDRQFRLMYVVVALIAQRVFDALGTSAWLSWVADIVPREARGKYYSVRLFLNTLAAVAVMLTAGSVIDAFGPGNATGYLIVFGIGFVLGEVDLLIHSFVRDRPMVGDRSEAKMLPLLAAPWRHAGFRNWMLCRAMLMFAAGLVGPFGLYYFKNELGLTPFWLSVLAATLMGAQAAGFFLWRRVGERIGYRSVALVANLLTAAGAVYWLFLPAGRFAVFFPVLLASRVFYGLLNSGLMLSASTLNMNTAPDEHRSAYFAQVTALTALAMSLGTFCGRWIFIAVKPHVHATFLGTRITAVHVLIALYAALRVVTILFFYRRIPDVKAEAAWPRIRRLLRTNPLRVFPTLLSMERPVSGRERDEHLDSMKRLIAGPDADGKDRDLEAVLRDPVREEEEFYGILGRVRTTRAREVTRMVHEIAAATVHRPGAEARAAADEIKRLYAEGDFSACLALLHRLAHDLAERWGASQAGPALAVIDGLMDAARAGREPRKESVQLALYAYLQIVRGRERGTRIRRVERMIDEIAESAVVHLPSARAKAGAKRIKKLYADGELGLCLRRVQRLAHETADAWDSPRAASALSVIDRLVANVPPGGQPPEDAVLLAIYAYLQIVREETPGER